MSAYHTERLLFRAPLRVHAGGAARAHDLIASLTFVFQLVTVANSCDVFFKLKPSYGAFFVNLSVR